MKPKLPKQYLYVGTTEINAKLASSKGIESPVLLSDVYPGHFASKLSDKWGIIQVDVSHLSPEHFASYVGKTKKCWQKSLNNSGIVYYLSHISPKAIEKIAIYDSNSNYYITSNFVKLDKLNRKTNYKCNQALTKWLIGEPTYGSEFALAKESVKIDGFLHNRSGLDVYYIRSEKNKNHISLWSK